VFVVGPPGAGKTTTVAKLAARVGLGAGRQVVFGEADAERIGAAEQARIFSEYIGARLRTIDSPGDLDLAMVEAGERGCVVVDTAGVGEGDRDRLRSLWELRRAVPEAEVALLIPAGMHREEARRVLERFAIVRPTCVAFSRVDDGRRVGDLVTALSEFDLPLSFLTNGHRVPDDLQNATPRGLAALMLRQAGRSGRTSRQETHR
jgi:flagellar biosynthesis protein FlhF